ncbi:hypothetical protein V3C99_001825 [Haemonchus contortus]
MQFWLRLTLVFCFVVLLIADNQNLEKRPAHLSRYGRALLSRYGKRSVISPNNELLLCRSVNGEFMCIPYDDREGSD